jgi:cyclase
MLRTRVIPCLQLVGDSLVKTVRFSHPAYIGDPVNTVRIFNELEVDELCFLDIRASFERRKPNLELLSQIADECFMPLSYGGGITSIEEVRQILSIGFEKVIINTHAYRTPELVKELVNQFGSQAIVGSIDVKKNFFGQYGVYINGGSQKLRIDVVEWAQKLVEYGIGELLLSSMDREGTWDGYDVELLGRVTGKIDIPVIANCGAGSLADIGRVVSEAKVSAVALGSMVVYQRKGMGVLINFPDKTQLYETLG